MQLHCFFSCGVLPHHYAYRVVYIRFIGTHAHYDKIAVHTILLPKERL